MSEIKEPLFYARASIQTMMSKYKAPDLPPKGMFHYHQGVFLSGVYHNYLLTKEESWFDYIKDWVDSIIYPDGSINSYNPGMMDNIQPGILLYPLYDRTKDPRYKVALDVVTPCIYYGPKTKDGGLWHKHWHPDQMWLDGLYMGGPIMAEYASRFDKPEYIDLVTHQIITMRNKTKDEKTGLWYHANDSSKYQKWADKETGRSHEFWGRSIGWVPVAILDDLNFIPKDNSHYNEICDIVTDLLKSIVKFQSEEGRWYQVVDKGGVKGNWLENSCSCLFVTGICMAVERGLLDESYLDYARKGYEAVIKSLNWYGDQLVVGDVCIGTEVGDYDYYINRPVSLNDLHGVGAFLLMCASMQKYY